MELRSSSVRPCRRTHVTGVHRPVVHGTHGDLRGRHGGLVHLDAARGTSRLSWPAIQMTERPVRGIMVCRDEVFSVGRTFLPVAWSHRLQLTGKKVRPTEQGRRHARGRSLGQHYRFPPYYRQCTESKRFGDAHEFVIFFFV